MDIVPLAFCGVDGLTRWLVRVPAGPVIAAAAIAGLWGMSVQTTSLARVPELTRLDVTTAQREAAAAGYSTSFSLRDGPDRAGTVLDQQPEPGSFLARRSVIALAVSRGAKQVGVPDVRGMPVEEARRVIQGAELTPGDVTYRRAVGKEPDRVISTDPPQGATVDAGTRVDVVAAV
jgi:serine/threonine-protein kinase